MNRILPIVLSALALVVVVAMLTQTTTIDTPAPAAGPTDDAAAKVAVAYAWTTTAKADTTTDPFSLPSKPVDSLKRRCDCDGPANCTCKPGTCECPACSWTVKAFESAKKQSLPVAVWVGQRPGKVAGVLSYYADDYAGTPKPGVIVVRPEDGELAVLKRFAGTPTSAEIRAALQPIQGGAPTPIYSMPLAPAFQPGYGGFRPAVMGGGRRGGC